MWWWTAKPRQDREVNDCLLLFPWECCHCQGEASGQSCATQNQVRYVAVAHDTNTTPSGPVAQWALDVREGHTHKRQQRHYPSTSHQEEAEETRSPALSGAVLAKLWPRSGGGGRQEASNHRAGCPIFGDWRALIIGVRDFSAHTTHECRHRGQSKKGFDVVE